MRLFEVAHRCFYVQVGEKGRGAPYVDRRAIGGEEKCLPCPFLKIKNKFLDFRKKGSDCVHPYVKFAIQNVVLRVSKRKKLEMFISRTKCFD